MTSANPDPLVALGREVERLARRAALAETRTEELAELLTQLATDVTTLAARTAPTPGEAARAWLLTEDPDQALTDLTDLAEWLARVYLRYPAAILPSCWLWHPTLIEELRWLRATHHEAYDPDRGSWQKAADWHDRYRPATTHRITTTYAACELREHTPGGRQHQPPPQVPLTDAVALIATTWATTPGHPPVPTELQLRRADQHDDTHHRRTTP
ncbi:MAG: hypothetical protein ACRDQY_10670 [Pseudonocardiaceae bacterium]